MPAWRALATSFLPAEEVESRVISVVSNFEKVRAAACAACSHHPRPAPPLATRTASARSSLAGL